MVATAFNVPPLPGCELVQDVAHHAQRKLVLTQKYRSRVFVAQQRRLFIAMGAHQGLDLRVEHACGLDHATRTQRIRGRNHQHVRPRNMRLNQDGRVRGITRDGMDSAFAQGLDQFTVLLSHDERQPVCGQRFADTPADAAIADEHHMALNLARLGRHRQLRQGIIGALQGAREL